jgi:hypothetical protein
MNRVNLVASAVVLAALTGLTWCSGLVQYPTAKLTVKVVDETGHPIEGAKVVFSFPESKRYETSTNRVSTATNQNGLASASGKSDGYASFVVTKAGYYLSGEGTYFKELKAGHWVPQDRVVTVILKKIRNPIGLYVRKVLIEIPITTEPVGFDLEKADWISPHGEGEKSDFIFTLIKDMKNKDDLNGTVILSFSNDGDGLVEAESYRASKLRLPHLAPENGYLSRLERWVKKAPGQYPESNFAEKSDFFFRVRTKKNESGDIEESFYGKIHDDFVVQFTMTETAYVGFTYYLNPTPNDRNLEFDPDENLFGELAVREQVKNP